jgi:transposase
LRSRGRLTTKIHACVDTNGMPVRLELTTGEAHDNRLVTELLSDLKSGAMLLVDRGYDADWIRAFAGEHGAWANIPPKRNRKDLIVLAHICTGRAICGALLQQDRAMPARRYPVSASVAATQAFKPGSTCRSHAVKTRVRCALLVERRIFLGRARPSI